jgi:hypothetical protein
VKRRKLLKHLSDHGCIVFEGAKHTRVRNPVNGRKSVIPRHPEIKLGTTRAICQQLGVPPPTSN